MLDSFPHQTLSIPHRRKTLEFLNSVSPELIQLVIEEKTGFKIWEFSVFLMDYVLIRVPMDRNDVALMALTCLFVAYKVKKS